MTTEEHEVYGDLPAGGGGFVGGFIGLVKVVRRWNLGFNQEDGRELEGLGKLPKGFVYYKGSLEDARKLAKEHFDAQYDPSLVMLFSMPPSSFTNMTPENKAKFTSGAITSHAKIVGLTSKYGAALNLVTVPSMVDAYARKQGWYTDKLIDLSILRDIEDKEDTTDILLALSDQRAALWAALGEPDPLKTYREKATDKNGTQAPKLREALAKCVGEAWDGTWVKFAQVFNPSEGEWNSKKAEPKRYKIPAILEIYAGEKAAMDAGAKELAERAERNGENATADNSPAASIYPKLDQVTRDIYSANDFSNAFAELVAGAKNVKGKPAPVVKKFAADNALTVADAKLLLETV